MFLHNMGACLFRVVHHLYYNLHVSGCFLLLVVFCVLGGGSSDDNCSNQRCGSVNVRYPFRLNHTTCPSFTQFKDDTNFTLYCGDDDGLILGTNARVLSITEDSIWLNITELKSHYNIAGTAPGGCNTSVQASEPDIHFARGGPYVAAGDNQFISFGCSAGFLFTYQSNNASAYDTGGCEPFCGFDDPSDFPQVTESSYSACEANIKCCTSNFPATSRVTYWSIQPVNNGSTSSCGDYGIAFHSNYTDFQNTFGFRVLWALPDPLLLKQLNSSNNTATTFNVADLPEDFHTACSPGNSSQVIIDKDVPGYRCSCLPGYRGDGYALGNSCVDIDDCSTIKNNSCLARLAECRNTNGSYTCKCKSRWRVGDGMWNGTGCPVSPTLIKGLTITGCIIGLMLFALSVISATVVIDRRRKRGYFKQNGGFELQAYIAAGTGRQSTRFFKAEELKEATQSFSENLKLGRGGFGTVYRGKLKDGRVVAIKKANQPGDVDRNQFLNELAILTQINHRHIVKLHGCCLETANPLLVYEFVSNGDLEENLASARAMGWEKRLQVAIQVADALAYLHAAASPPILHRDVKTANILLDDNLDAKVADFGISRLIPEGERCVSTAVQGTLGYLDPEYFQTLQLTDKSDVYSLGVVLVELITGLKAVDNHAREVKFANLALLFIDRMRQDRLHDIVDARLLQYNMGENAGLLNGECEEADRWRLHTCIQDVAKLARRCLALRGVERPSLSELAMQLHQLTDQHASAQYDSEELRPLLHSLIL